MKKSILEWNRRDADFLLRNGYVDNTHKSYLWNARGHSVPFRMEHMPFDQDTRDIIYNTVFPRLTRNVESNKKFSIASIVKNSIDKGYVEYDPYFFEITGRRGAAGIYFPESGNIAIKKGEASFAAPHEVRHRIDYNTPLSNEQDDILSKAYDVDFTNTLPGIDKTLKNTDMYPERVTTNLDSRTLLLKDAIKNHRLEYQNSKIDDATDEAVFDAVARSNYYGQAYIDLLRSKNLLTPQKANQFRDAMKYVGAVSSPIGLYNYINNQK